MRSIACMPTCAFALGLAACGADYGRSISELIPDDIGIEPGCYAAPETNAVVLTLPSNPPGADVLRLDAERSLRDFRLSTTLQYLGLLRGIMEDDPYASEWSITKNDITFEVGVLARGDDWAIVKLVIVGDDLPIPPAATIELLPGRAVIELGAETVEFAPNYVRAGDFVRGCDPRTLTSFTVGPAVVDGVVAEDVPQCWSSGRLFPSTARGLTSGGGAGPNGGELTPAQQAEFDASTDLQCLQLIARVTSR